MTAPTVVAHWADIGSRLVTPRPSSAAGNERRFRPLGVVPGMAASGPDDGDVRLSWILVFLLLSLGLGASAVLAVGGDILPTVAPLG